MDEDRIVQEFLRPLSEGVPGALGLRDDCCILAPAPGEEFVVKTDAVVAGTHFFPDDQPVDIGYKALAVAVSDLIAKAAAPRYWQLTLALPEPPKVDWLRDLTHGFAEVQALTGIRLTGGDLVRTNGPVLLSVTAIGTVAKGRMVRRGGAGLDDLVYVSGSIGDAALGLLVRTGDIVLREGVLGEGADRDFLLRRYLRPQLRLGLVSAIAGFASAAMDVSDGLVLDFERMCRASGMGGLIDLDLVPLSDAARRVIAANADCGTRAVTGGDDYEVLLTVPPERKDAFEHAVLQSGVAVTRIGKIHSNGPQAVKLAGAWAARVRGRAAGFQHFDHEQGK